MKHKVIFWAAASVLAVLAACNKPSGLEPQISVSAKDPVEAPATEYSYSFKLTATVDWEIRGLDEDEKSWLEVSPVSGADMRMFSAAGTNMVEVPAGGCVVFVLDIDKAQKF